MPIGIANRSEPFRLCKTCYLDGELTIAVTALHRACHSTHPSVNYAKLLVRPTHQRIQAAAQSKAASGLPPLTDIKGTRRYVSKVPIADVE
jgi:hypothetical protein